MNRRGRTWAGMVLALLSLGAAAATIQVAQRSAVRTMGDLSASASCTSLIIFSSELSSSFFVALISKTPNWLIVPERTSSPMVLSTGTDSPVMVD